MTRGIIISWFILSSTVPFYDLLSSYSKRTEGILVVLLAVYKALCDEEGRYVAVPFEPPLLRVILIVTQSAIAQPWQRLELAVGDSFFVNTYGPPFPSY